MSFLKKLFGGGGGGGEPAEPKSAAPAKQVEHKGFLSKEIDGVMKEHKFIRADRFAGLDDAIDISIKKGMQLIDEQGERIFG